MKRRPPRSTLFPCATLFRPVADRLVEQLPVARLASDLPGVQQHPGQQRLVVEHLLEVRHHPEGVQDRKSTRLNSSHANISYAVFCLKKKNNKAPRTCPFSQS